MIFKKDDTGGEFEQVHALNYRTFAEEIGQFAADGSGILVDRFHAKNTYFVAVEQERVLGMVAVHDEPPFSAASRLADRTVLGTLRRPLEVRLLAIEPHARHRMILAGLMWKAFEAAQGRGCSHILISGRAEKLRIYEKLGFRTLGPAVRAGAAWFSPMALAMEDAVQHPMRGWIQSRSKCFVPLRSSARLP